jgi:MFS family permease
MVPRSILAAPTRRAALIAMLLMGTIVAAYVYFVSLYLQRVEGFTPIATGLALVPSTLTVVLTTTLATRRLLAHFGVKALLLAGLGFIAVGQLWLAQITVGASYAITVLPGQVLTAFGMGLAFPTASVAVTSGVQRSDQGLAGALFTTAQQTGAAIGLAMLATLAAAHHKHTRFANGRIPLLVSSSPPASPPPPLLSPGSSAPDPASRNSRARTPANPRRCLRSRRHCAGSDAAISSALLSTEGRRALRAGRPPGQRQDWRPVRRRVAIAQTRASADRLRGTPVGC